MKWALINIVMLMSVGGYTVCLSAAASSSSGYKNFINVNKPPGKGAVLHSLTEKQVQETVTFFDLVAKAAQEGNIKALMSYWPKAEQFDEEHNKFTTIFVAQYVLPCAKQTANWRDLSALASLISGTMHYELMWKKAQLGFKKETTWHNEHEQEMYDFIFSWRKGKPKGDLEVFCALYDTSANIDAYGLPCAYRNSVSIEFWRECRVRPMRAWHAGCNVPEGIAFHQKGAGLLK